MKAIQMRLKAAAVLLFLVLTGCVGSPEWHGMKMQFTASEANGNNRKMMALNVGQSKEDVLNKMGMPAKREVYQLQQKVVEVLFYRTRGWSLKEYSDGDGQFTPLVFENNTLMGWGWAQYSKIEVNQSGGGR